MSLHNYTGLQNLSPSRMSHVIGCNALMRACQHGFDSSSNVLVPTSEVVVVDLKRRHVRHARPTRWQSACKQQANSGQQTFDYLLPSQSDAVAALVQRAPSLLPQMTLVLLYRGQPIHDMHASIS